MPLSIPPQNVPYYAVIFTSLRTHVYQGYTQMNEELSKLLANQIGYLGMDSVRGQDGFGITVSYWDSLESIDAWRQDQTHARAKAMGRQLWYERYAIRICKVETERFFPSEAESTAQK